MDFRYRLAKKTFKNKKIPKKRATGMDVISHDQRGDDSSPEISPLSLDKQTITPKPKPQEEEKEVSRRDLFSFGGFMKSAAELDVKPIEETEDEEELQDSLEIDETLDKPITDLKTDGSLVEKKGFFKRLISRFRPDSGSDIKELSSTDPIKTELTNSKNEDLSSTVPLRRI